MAVVVLTDCCSSEVAKGPQLSLKNFWNSKGKAEGKTHTHSQRDIWRRKRDLSMTSDFPRNLKETQAMKVVLRKSWQSKGEGIKEITVALVTALDAAG